MEIDILTAEQTKINFAPRNVYEEIAQNVRTIILTPRYSVPLDRRFGIDAEFLDRPTPKAITQIKAEIFQAVRRYEPRCKVVKISVDGDMDGKLNMKVRISINQ